MTIPCFSKQMINEANLFIYFYRSAYTTIYEQMFGGSHTYLWVLFFPNRCYIDESTTLYIQDVLAVHYNFPSLELRCPNQHNNTQSSPYRHGLTRLEWKNWVTCTEPGLRPHWTPLDSPPHHHFLKFTGKPFQNSVGYYNYNVGLNLKMVRCPHTSPPGWYEQLLSIFCYN